MEGLHSHSLRGMLRASQGNTEQSPVLSFPLSLARLADFLRRAVGLVFFKKSCPKVATVKPPSKRAVEVVRRPETSGFLGSNPLIHSCSLFLHLPLYPPPCPHSFILSPSPLMTRQAHATEKFADRWAVPSPLPPLPSRPCRGAGLVLGREP